MPISPATSLTPWFTIPSSTTHISVQGSSNHREKEGRTSRLRQAGGAAGAGIAADELVGFLVDHAVGT